MQCHSIAQKVLAGNCNNFRLRECICTPHLKFAKMRNLFDLAWLLMPTLFCNKTFFCNYIFVWWRIHSQILCFAGRLDIIKHVFCIRWQLSGNFFSLNFFICPKCCNYYFILPTKGEVKAFWTRYSNSNLTIFLKSKHWGIFEKI
jgi:hypothetical protein